MNQQDRGFAFALVLSIVLSTIIVVAAPMMFHVGDQDLVAKTSDFEL